MLELFLSQNAHSSLQKLHSAWESERLTKGNKASVGMAIIRAYWKPFFIIVLTGVIAECSIGGSFYTTSLIIDKLVQGDAQEGLLYCLAFSGFIIITLIFRHKSQELNGQLFVEIREALSSLLYQKSLSLGLRSVSEVSEGKIINAASSDLVVLDMGYQFISHLFIEPIVAVVHFLLLAQLVGYIVGLGFLIIFALLLLQMVFGKCITQVRGKAAQFTDQRLKLLYDTVSGVRTIKAYGWEIEMMRKVEKIRRKETSQLIKLNFFQILAYSSIRNCGYLSAALILSIKASQDDFPSAGRVFALYASFVFLSLFLGALLGQGITALAKFKTTLKRTASILLLEEKTQNQRILDPQTGNISQSLPNSVTSNAPLSFHNASFSWGLKLKGNEGTERNESTNVSNCVLKKLNFEVKEGELLVVIGPVGSGKTSLLLSILGENYLEGDKGNESLFQKKEGILKRVAYAEQEPFILSESVQDNITFGLEYDQEKFAQVSTMACLEEDYSQLAKGQLTLIGQRGVNLSGGQKARIALARALYSEAQLYLLDDPLSAVDPKVSSALMERAILKYLKGKTRILVTHQLHVLPKADRILYLEGGEVKFIGTYSELQLKDLDLSNVLNKANQESYGKIESEPSIDEQNSQQPAHDEEIKAQENENILEEKAVFIYEDTPVLKRDGKTLDRSQTMNLIIVQEKKEGSLNCKDICTYTSYSAGCFTPFIIIILGVIPALVILYISEWLRVWVSQDSSEQLNSYYSKIFWLIIAIYIVTLFLLIFILSSLTILQTQRLHNKMVTALLRTSVSFFDSNPVGRILNRFSKDISMGDMVLPILSSWFIEICFNVAVLFTLLCITIPWASIVLAFVVCIVLVIRLKVMVVLKEAMRLNLLSRSPVATILGATLSGLSTIRAYTREHFFLKEFLGKIEINARAFMTFQLLSRSLGFYLDSICGLLIISSTFLSFVIDRDPLLLAIVIQLLTTLLGSFQFLA